MNFLENILQRLARAPGRVVIQEARDGKLGPATSGELLALVNAARAFLRSAGVKKGDRCALLAHNSIRWTALDLAMMSEGAIVVPLYARQAAHELVGMMKDCSPALLCCGDAALRDAVRSIWPEAPRAVLFDEIFATPGDGGAAVALSDADPVTIIYTSGTSGELKGVVLNVGNLNHMLPCTGARLDLLMGDVRTEPDRIFHYLPCCFAGSWILMLTALSRNSVLTLSTDLTKLADEMKLAAPDYFLNVPALLERVRRGIEEQVAQRGGFALRVFTKGRAAWLRRREGKSSGLNFVWLALAEGLVFPAIRKKLGPNLRALICGSAPLAVETQLFFIMLGIPVLQVYGLTETTAICTLDHPQQAVPGRVGPAIPQVEMKLGENSEILVRGPNIFPGYWNRPQETAKVLRLGPGGTWFHTGDQGDVDAAGNWRIIGRVKNLIIPASGHNVAPEPIEDALLQRLPGAQQVVLVGNGRSFLAALITGPVLREQAQRVIDGVNDGLPHYKQVRRFCLIAEPFTIEGGQLTANGKLKRDAIAARYTAEIEELYRT